MLGNFSYINATKLYFGDESLQYLNEELPKYGKNVQLIYGGGSIKKNGVYDAVMELLKANGKTVIEGIADGTFILEGGYKVLTRDEVVSILKESL